MKKLNYKRKLTCFLLIPSVFVTSYFLSFFPEALEKYYSRGIFYLSGQFLSTVTGVVPFSLAEIIIISLTLYLIITLVRLSFIILKRKPQRKSAIIKFIVNSVVSLSFLYFLFTILWGLNYHRLPLSNSLKYLKRNRDAYSIPI